MSLKIINVTQKVGKEYEEGMERVFGKRCVKCKRKEADCACEAKKKIATKNSEG
jgi:hypothetical protein